MDKVKKNLISEQEGIEALMAIIEGVQEKTGAPMVTINVPAEVSLEDTESKVYIIPTESGKPVKVVTEAQPIKGVTILPAAEPVRGTVYQHGMAIEVDGKKTTTGPRKSNGKRGGAAKDDKGKEALKELYIKTLQAHPIYGGSNSFIHSTEGLIIRMVEADYSIKVSKSKEMKFDITDEDFEVEKDFSVRGKAKNSAPAIAKVVLAALETSDLKFDLISAKASGIILQMMGGEYTIKISKKRDRVGFEAEKGSAY